MDTAPPPVTLHAVALPASIGVLLLWGLALVIICLIDAIVEDSNGPRSR